MPVGGALRQAPAGRAVLVLAEQHERLDRARSERDHGRARRSPVAATVAPGDEGPAAPRADQHETGRRARRRPSPRGRARPAPGQRSTRPAARAAQRVRQRAAPAPRPSTAAPRARRCARRRRRGPAPAGSGRRQARGITGSRPSRAAHAQVSATTPRLASAAHRLQDPERGRGRGSFASGSVTSVKSGP